MKEKILTQLKLKFPGAPASVLNSVADKLAKKVTEEPAIEGAISELENSAYSITDIIADFQAEGDRRVSSAKTEWEKKNPRKQWYQFWKRGR